MPRYAARTLEILNRLDKKYGTEDRCGLDYETDWQLLFATELSAQCTDARVNIVTKDLFKKYTSIEDFAKADVREIEEDIRSTGFYRNKAKNLKSGAVRIMTEYGGIVPDNMEDLLTIAGVGRKTANVLLGHIHKVPGIVVDTHVGRISRRLDLTKEDDPVKVEFDLYKKIPKDNWIRFNFQMISFGREICRSRGPKCNECFLSDICRSKDKKVK
ncbi:MAG: endonuclease III [Clostridiales bacterium]|nr:endonuclease III [Clostridiales bacterium]MBS5878177.1 endonuclease III [Clostridiales bacterium]MDU0939353.1 endonuclease III [Clostridiales bacterium]MDU1042337.1 endonuclease III [Clostridiales bacterium]MDU3490081.1 endonuclease III [Clostridiales bacterium]